MTLEAGGLAFAYPGRPPIFADVAFRLAPGERTAILGGNGSGKSTLGRCLAGWQTGTDPQAVTWEGRAWGRIDPATRAGTVQYVGQRPHLQLSGRASNVREEVAFGPENLCLERAEIAARTEEALASLRLTGLAGRDCLTLSGGEMQRLAIAGALALQPALLVLDEPTTDLDAEAREGLVAHLRGLSRAMALIVLDLGPQRWMEGFIDRYLVLAEGRLHGPFDLEEVLNGAFGEVLVLPGAAAALVAGRAAGRLPADRPIPATGDAQRALLAQFAP